MPGSDAKLDDYRKKRNFQHTQEPNGEETWPAANDQPVFVIQKHDASTLHYDFRLEVDGVLKSWAVPKGPSTNPADKRLAVPTEDHPLAYADFEGLIPEGEYGAGAVIVWDRGNYRNLRAKKEEDAASMEQALAEGKVEVWLEGEKLQGGYALIRTSADPKDEKWLLIKMDDDQADARRKPTSTQPASALSGRTLAEVREKETE